MLSALARDVYAACVARGPSTLRQLTDELGHPSLVRAAAAELVEVGLLSSESSEVADASGRRPQMLYAAHPPRAPLARFAEQRQRDAVTALELASALGRLWHEHRDPAPYLEFLETDAEASAADEALLEDAREEVLALSIGPVGEPAHRPPAEMSDGFVQARGRGVEFRVVYGTRLMRDPVALEAVLGSIELGEQVRVFPDVPLNLRIADAGRAVLTVAGRPGERRHAVVIHPSGLLDAMVGLFTSYWRMAAPLSSDAAAVPGSNGPDQETRQLLAHLAAGLTDESIARELGVSERTVGRRIARLQERLGAASRFQLGLQASRQGWL